MIIFNNSSLYNVEVFNYLFQKHRNCFNNKSINNYFFQIN